MGESVGTQIKDVPGTLVGTVRKTPVLAIGVMFGVLFLVLLLEAYKPGLFTGPVKSFLHMIGVSTA
jgi:hypothetical protein